MFLNSYDGFVDDRMYIFGLTVSVIYFAILVMMLMFKGS